MTRLLFLTAQNSESAVALIRRILEGDSTHVVHVVLEQKQRSFRSRIRSQLKHLKKNGLLWIPYRIFVAGKSALSPKKSSRTLSDLASTLESEFGERFIFRPVPDLHDPEFLQFVADSHFLLGIVFGTRVLKQSLFRLPEKGMMNIHQGIIPDYRGMPPGFWELFNGERETGVTFHAVTDTLDGGEIILQKRVTLDSRGGVELVQQQLDTLAAEHIREAVALACQPGGVRTKPDLSLGRCYQQPTVRDLLKFYWRKKTQRSSDL